MGLKRLEWLKISRVVTNAATVVPPFQGGWEEGGLFQGRCPWLWSSAPLGGDRNPQVQADPWFTRAWPRGSALPPTANHPTLSFGANNSMGLC